MTDKTVQQAIIAFLKRDPLRNIVPLKMLTAYPTVIDTHYYEAGNGAAALLLFPTSAFAYDRATYADLDLVVILAATTAEAATALLPQIPMQRRLIFKLMDAHVRDLLATRFTLQRVTAFLSYTATAIDHFAPSPDVVPAAQVDERLYPHFAAQGHDAEELQRYFADGQARAFTLYKSAEPIASCFTYRNFEQIHEIGGVFTIPGERRKGHAQQVVTTAVHALRQRDCLPRYQVHEGNQPSIALAEQIGLTRFVTVEHWRYVPG
ncbi:MAG: GNAT family N-acetyltransferase [Caldilinea sp. CFX5]|nr:GNAT family N-acetyltransferase [Caldilinea sp. CFX5]